MALIGQIEALIEEEVQSRVDGILTPLLEYISHTYDISLNQLMSDIGRVQQKPVLTACQGLAKKGKRCKNRGKANGYCHMHQNQVPKKPERKFQQHTHTLPPFFMKGCPVCEPVVKNLVDCFDNE